MNYRLTQKQLEDLGKERTNNLVWMQETFHFLCVYVIKDWVVSRLSINFSGGNKDTDKYDGNSALGYNTIKAGFY